MTNKRVVVTGVGTVNALGHNTADFWSRLIDGQCGISKITAFDPAEHKSQVAGQVKDFDITAYGIEKKEERKMSRFIQLAVVAANEAVKDSGYNIAENPQSIGVLIGSGIGGIDVVEENYRVYQEKGPGRVSPFMVPMIIADSASGVVSIQTGAQGPNLCTTTACASGTHSIGDAFSLIKNGKITAMIAGGTEACITPLTVAGFASAKALCSDSNDNPTKASRPFDATRGGFVIAEGAGVLVLEELEHALGRGAKIYAEVVGYGATGDAYHITAPAPEGEGGARAMQIALKEAHLKPEDIDYINAHGTSTSLNDKYETAAIKTIFGAETKVKVSSIKGAIGHSLGAAGGIEAVVLAKTIETGIIPPTINYQNQDPECDLDYVPNKAVKQEVRAAMSNSFGFGGHNGIIIFKKYQS